jgi:hypothetical protein
MNDYENDIINREPARDIWNVKWIEIKRRFSIFFCVYIAPVSMLEHMWEPRRSEKHSRMKKRDIVFLMLPKAAGITTYCR